jgi:hypothetical protein
LLGPESESHQNMFLFLFCTSCDIPVLQGKGVGAKAALFCCSVAGSGAALLHYLNIATWGGWSALVPIILLATDTQWSPPRRLSSNIHSEDGTPFSFTYIEPVLWIRNFSFRIRLRIRIRLFNKFRIRLRIQLSKSSCLGTDLFPDEI